MLGCCFFSRINQSSDNRVSMKVQVQSPHGNKMDVQLENASQSTAQQVLSDVLSSAVQQPHDDLTSLHSRVVSATILPQTPSAPQSGALTAQPINPNDTDLYDVPDSPGFVSAGPPEGVPPTTSAPKPGAPTAQPINPNDTGRLLAVPHSPAPQPGFVHAVPLKPSAPPLEALAM